MNRYILIAIVLPISVTVFKILGYKYVIKKMFYEDFTYFLSLIENEVNFSQNSITYVFNNFQNKRHFFNYASNKFYKNEYKNKIMTESEKSDFDNFFNNLGKLDKNTQKDALLFAKNSVNKAYDKAKEDESKKSPMYFKLGILTGIAIFIILI